MYRISSISVSELRLVVLQTSEGNEQTVADAAVYEILCGCLFYLVLSPVEGVTRCAAVLILCLSIGIHGRKVH